MTQRELLLVCYRLLERWGIDRLPLDPVAVARAEGIAVKTLPAEQRLAYPALAKGDAALLTGNGEPVLLLISSSVEQRRRFTLCHELAHWALGENKNESDADALANLLLCPPVVLHFCAVQNARQIAALSQVSVQVSAIAYSKLLARRKMGDFLHLLEERRCAERFLPFVSDVLSRPVPTPPHVNLDL